MKRFAAIFLLPQLFLLPFLLLPAKVSAQGQCVHYYMNYDTMYWQNLCNVPIIIEWNTAMGACSGSGCGTGYFGPGEHMATASRRGDGSFNWIVCYYQDWADGLCTLN